MVEADSAVFLNTDEFAELHMVDGKETKVVLDDNRLMERQGGAELGVAESDLLLYARESDLPPRKAPGSALNVDGREYVISDWRVDMGMATVALQQNRII
jgi:hypothetical protein